MPTIISPDKNGTIDPVVVKILSQIETDILLVPITRTENFQFNESLLSLDRYCLFDFVEYGWNWDRGETHVFGYNTDLFTDKFYGDEWKRFDDFISKKPPVVYFKREMLVSCNQNVRPIDWPCFHQIPALETRDQFCSRPIDVFFSWGHSNEIRRRIHGEIFINSTKSGYGIIDNPYNIERGLWEYKKIWLTMQTPHYARLRMEQLLFIQGKSKLSLSYPGAGVKCFRMAESPINSIMVMQHDEMMYSYAWSHWHNCIKTEIGGEIETIEAALRRDDLFDIYQNGVETVKKYYLPDYCKDYIEPIIKMNS